MRLVLRNATRSCRFRGNVDLYMQQLSCLIGFVVVVVVVIVLFVYLFVCLFGWLVLTTFLCVLLILQQVLSTINTTTTTTTQKVFFCCSLLHQVLDNLVLFAKLIVVSPYVNNKFFASFIAASPCVNNKFFASFTAASSNDIVVFVWFIVYRVLHSLVLLASSLFHQIWHNRVVFAQFVDA